MPDHAITAERLSKQYTIYHESHPHDGLRHVLHQAFSAPLRWLRPSSVPSRPPERETFWALKEVSFEVPRGQVLGVLGRNGAGKSTLLKILSRITDPSGGRAVVRGRVSSLLEVGTGFHPELTGRENIFVNGAILGMMRRDIQARFDEIVDFAGVARFIDTPVKRYSSGMYIRLAFAVAAHLEPEILIVDEVLAVGDIEFQKKCLGKMKSVATSDGRTILFVSHNLSAIQTLCSEALYLRDGQVVAKGDVDSVAMLYAHEAASSGAGDSVRRPLSSWLTLDSIRLTPNPAPSGTAVSFSVELSAARDSRLKELALEFYSGIGTKVALVDMRSTTLDYSFGPGRILRLAGRIAQLNFVEGNYTVGIYINCGDVDGHFSDLCTMTILRADRPLDVTPYASRDRGFVDLEYEFSRV